MNIVDSLYTRKLYKISVFLYLVFLFSCSSMAGYNIFWGIVSIFLLANINRWKKIDFLHAKNFLICYMFFFFTLFVAAALLGDKQSLQKTGRYLIWTMPFWIMFISQSLSFDDKLIKWGSIIAILPLAISALPQVLTRSRIIGYFGQPTLLATVLALLVPFSIMIVIDTIQREGCNKKNIIMLFITILGILTLVFTKTRGAIAGVFLGGIILLAVLCKIKYAGRQNKRKKLIVLLIVLFTFTCAGGYFTGVLHRSYDYERALLLESSYNMWEDHKIYGVGMGNWAKEYPKYRSPHAKEPNLTIPHNVIASFFDEMGLIGGVGYIVFVIGTFIFLINKIQNNPDNHYYQAALWAFTALTCHGMIDTGITNRFAMQFISAILGIAIASEYARDIETDCSIK